MLHIMSVVGLSAFEVPLNKRVFDTHFHYFQFTFFTTILYIS